MSDNQDWNVMHGDRVEVMVNLKGEAVELRFTSTAKKSSIDVKMNAHEARDLAKNITAAANEVVACQLN